MTTKRIYIEYKVDGVLENAYSVSLSSEDSSYGVKDQDGNIVVSDNTSVTNSDTGVYEYELEVEDNIIYTVSWEIVPSMGSESVFAVQSVGPFDSVTESEVKAIPDIRGKFIQGTQGVLFLSLTDVHGNPLTAESISLTVSKDGTDALTDVSPDYIKPGLYTFDWSIPIDLEIGKYIVTWSYTINGFSEQELQEIVISSSGDTLNASVQFYGSRFGEIRLALSEMICCAQKIPVYYEQGNPDLARKIFKLTFPKWNQAYGTRIYRNNKIIESGYTIDYFYGKIIFDNSQTQYDVINADYNFKWFSDDQLDRFLMNALSTVNFYPPQSTYSIFNIPDSYIPIILYGAAKDAIRNLLLCLQFQQPQKVFGGPDAAQKAFSNMETLKKNYEDEFNKLVDQKKFGRYPSIKAVVTPEFTLPGGRSRWFRYLFSSGS
jgi:hypothetical protein